MFTSKKKAIRYARELRRQGLEVKVFAHDTIVSLPTGNEVFRSYTVSVVRPECQTHELVKFRADGTNRLSDEYIAPTPVAPTRERMFQ